MKIVKEDGSELTKEQLDYVMDKYINGPWLVEDTELGKRVVLENYQAYEEFINITYGWEVPDHVKCTPLAALGPGGEVLYGKFKKL
jgi:hypothetical protein